MLADRENPETPVRVVVAPSLDGAPWCYARARRVLVIADTGSPERNAAVVKAAAAALGITIEIAN